MSFVGNPAVYSYSLMLFHHIFQSSLVCSFPLDALPCEEAPNFFEGPDSINARFGVVEDSAESDY